MSADPATRRSDPPAMEPVIGAVPVAGKAAVSVDGILPPRRLGVLAGKICIPDDFDDPLPDDILAEFEGR